MYGHVSLVSQINAPHVPVPSIITMRRPSIGMNLNRALKRGIAGSMYSVFDEYDWLREEVLSVYRSRRLLPGLECYPAFLHENAPAKPTRQPSREEPPSRDVWWSTWFLSSGRHTVCTARWDLLYWNPGNTQDQVPSYEEVLEDGGDQLKSIHKADSRVTE